MKKIISVLVILCLLSSLATFAFADNTTSVYANISAGTFSVSVPTRIDITSSKNGVKQTDTITNTGNLPVKVSSIKVTEENGWTKIASNLSFTSYKQFKLDVTPPTSTIPVEGTASYDYTVSLPTIQPKDVNEKIATITVTVAVDDAFYAPVEPSIEPSLPQAFTPTQISISNVVYYKIAEYGAYSLLLLNDTVEYHPTSLPEGAVSVNYSKDYSIPSSEGYATFFDLSASEINAYYSGVTAPSNAFLLRIGSDNTTYHVDTSNVVQLGTPAPSYYRPAVWVETSSLPSTTT